MNMLPYALCALYEAKDLGLEVETVILKDRELTNRGDNHEKDSCNGWHSFC